MLNKDIDSQCLVRADIGRNFRMLGQRTREEEGMEIHQDRSRGEWFRTEKQLTYKSLRKSRPRRLAQWQDLASNNVGMSEGDSLATWRLGSGLAIELLKAYENIKAVCMWPSVVNIKHWGQ